MTVQNFSSKAQNPRARTMAELLAGGKYRPLVPRRGETFDAAVISITRGRVMLDFGAKSEGIVAGEEYDAVKDFIKTLKAGRPNQAVPIKIIFIFLLFFCAIVFFNFNRFICKQNSIKMVNFMLDNPRHHSGCGKLGFFTIAVIIS
mgnify:CR=1 FL=1